MTATPDREIVAHCAEEILASNYRDHSQRARSAKTVAVYVLGTPLQASPEVPKAAEILERTLREQAVAEAAHLDRSAERFHAALEEVRKLATTEGPAA